MICLFGTSSCSCDGESVFKIVTWGFHKVAGEGYFPSAEILALGDFENVEVSIQKSVQNGKRFNEVGLRLINGKGPQMHEREELIARRAAELYAEGYSKIEEFDSIIVTFIQTDPFNPENLAMSEYSFQVKDLIFHQTYQ